jgi:hypothetical protein
VVEVGAEVEAETENSIGLEIGIETIKIEIETE